MAVKTERKAYRVDLKWICGILSTLLLLTSLGALALYRISSNSNIRKIRKSSFSKKSMFNADVFAIPDDMNITIDGKKYSAKDMAAMSKEERKKLFKEGMMSKQKNNFSKDAPPNRFAQGEMPKGALSNMGEMTGAMMEQSILPVASGFLTDAIKGTYLAVFITTLIAALFFMILMIIFSYRFGRILSLGVVLLVASLPVFSASVFFKTMSSFSGNSTDGVSLILVLAKANFGLFLYLVIFACGLIFLSLILSLAIKGKTSSSKVNQ